MSGAAYAQFARDSSSADEIPVNPVVVDWPEIGLIAVSLVVAAIVLRRTRRSRRAAPQEATHSWAIALSENGA